MIEAGQVEGHIRKFVKEQENADADKHHSAKSLNPQEMPTKSLKDGEKTGQAEGHENKRYSKARRINSQEAGSLPYGVLRRRHHQHGGQRGPGARGPAESESQPEQEGTELALPYLALKSEISMQESNRKPSQENQAKEDDARTGDTIQPVTVGGQETAYGPRRSAQGYEQNGKAKHKEKRIEEDRPPMPGTIFLQLLRAETRHGSHKSRHQRQDARGQEGNHAGQKGRCIG